MATYSIKRTLFAITLSVIAVGCVREADQQPLEQDQENLHEVVFHAGWAPETKTVLQEDGSVWWSPGDEISLFVGGGENGGYRLTSTNTDPTATADFLGQICESESTFSAVYPYDSRNYFDGTHFGIFLNGEQVAKEGSFANQSLVSIAQSTDNNLYFRNVCGGIKFSVANEGITKLYLHTVNGTIGGHLEYVLDENGIPQFSGSGPYGGISDLTVWAPEHGTFEPGKYYYIVLPAKIITNGLSITFYKGDDCAVWSYPHSVEIHRSAFKRLKNVDEGLTFHKTVYDNAAKLYSFLPNEIDKQRITGIKFHVKDDTITEHQLIASVPVNYNVDGTTVNIYTTAELFDISDVTPNMFKGYSALQTLDLSKTIVPSAGSLSRMFQECISLESIIFGDWDTRKVQSMDMMFTRCEMLRTLDLSFMNTDNVTSMLGIFGDCKTLTSLNISSFNTFNITEMRGMFGGCRALLSLDVSSFDTSNVTDMGGMFGSCCSLESLDLSSFNTANVTDMDAMFEGCASLKTLDLSFFNTF